MKITALSVCSTNLKGIIWELTTIHDRFLKNITMDLYFTDTIY
jgi:hypothetical protein